MNLLLNKYSLLFISLLLSLICNSQSIEIGQKAEYVKSVVEWSTSKQNQSNPLKRLSEPYWTCDSKYIDGKLVEVLQNYRNQYLIDFKITTDYCEHFIMRNDTLHHTIKEFKNISLDQIKTKYTEIYLIYKIDEMYFIDGFEYYYKFRVNSSKIAFAEYYKTNVSEWDKKTQQNFNAKKEAIEQKKSNDAIKNLMAKSHKAKYYNKQFENLGVDLKSEQEFNSIATSKAKNELKGRKVISKFNPKYLCNQEGRVTVQITVDNSGKVIDAKAGVNGTTNFAECLLAEAKKAALNTRWEPISDSESQVGIISYTFQLTE